MSRSAELAVVNAFASTSDDRRRVAVPHLRVAVSRTCPVAVVKKWPPMETELIEQLPWDASSPGRARTCVADFVGAAGCAEQASEAALLVSELVTNAFRHGSGPIELRARWANGVLRVEVHDTSVVMPRLREPHADGGRGLRIVAAIASGWGSRLHMGDGKVTWFELRPS
jgi:hypothetical protein